MMLLLHSKRPVALALPVAARESALPQAAATQTPARFAGPLIERAPPGCLTLRESIGPIESAPSRVPRSCRLASQRGPPVLCPAEKRPVNRARPQRPPLGGLPDGVA